jgi:hypothetical protein
VEFESDCANLVQMVADPSMDRSAILAMIIDIKEILARRRFESGLEDLERTK